MLKIFQGKNGGVISTMLAFMMVAILGISGVLVELGRYQSSSAIFDEAVQSAGFSTIACKDKDLLKNYGLLAVDGSTDLNKTVEKYLKGNLGGSSSSTYNVESLIQQVDNVAAEGIYSLNEAEVLKRQILEVSKYRGPIRLVDDTIDIKALLSSLSGAFSGLSAISKFANKASAAIEKLISFVNAVKGIVEAINDLSDSKAKYQKAYNELKTALVERDKVADAKDNMEKPTDPRDEKDTAKYKDKNGNFDEEKYKKDKENYDKKLLPEYEKWEKRHKKYESLIEKIDGKAGEKGLKQEYIDAAEDVQKKYKGFMDAAKKITEEYNDLLSGGLDICFDHLIEEVKKSDQDKETQNEIIEVYKMGKKSIQAELKDSKEVVSSFCDEIDDIQDKMTEVKMEDVITYLELHTAENIVLKDFQEKHTKINLAKLVSDLITELQNDFFKAIINKIVKLVETLISTVGNLIKVLSCVSGDWIFSNPTLDVKVNDSTWDLIQDNHNNQGSSISSHDAEDKALADEKKQEAGAPEQDSDSLMDSLNVEINNMADGIQKVLNAANGLKDKQLEPKSILMKVLTQITGLDKLISVYNIIKNLGEFIDGIVKITTAAMKIAALVLTNLVTIIYNNILVNTYATKMFSNRTSRVKDTTMLGVKLKDIARGKPNSSIREEVRSLIENTPSFSFLKGTSLSKNTDYAFAGAEAEYVFAGGRSEIDNQRIVGLCIMIIRMLSNIPAVFTNKYAVDAMAAVGPFAPLVFILFWIGETAMDMFFLSNGVAVPLVKIGDMCFLSAEGVKNIAAKIKELGKEFDQKLFFDKLSKIIVGEGSANKNLKIETNKKTSKKELIYKGANDSLKATIKKLIEFDYEEHLWLLLCFVSNKTKVRRIGDLVQMEMNARDGNNNFKLSEAYTYVRVQSKVNFRPLIPVPGLSDSIGLQSIKYVGF